MTIRATIALLPIVYSLLLPCRAQVAHSLGMQFVPVQAGRFYMGSERNGKDRDESPVHRVTLSSGFRLATTEVTNAQFEAFDPTHKRLRGYQGFSTLDDEAVVMVSYPEAVAFCEWLSRKEGKPYRLPTEAEWEYACRAGTISDFSTGNALPTAYHKSQTTSRTANRVSLRVAQTPANPWGLYDMHGNVEEWCLDWYGAYPASEQRDPAGRATGLYRVTRSGSHGTPVTFLRSANRLAMLPDDKSWLVGFRVVQAPMPASTPLPAIPPDPTPPPLRSKKPAGTHLSRQSRSSTPPCGTWLSLTASGRSRSTAIIINRPLPGAPTVIC